MNRFLTGLYLKANDTAGAVARRIDRRGAGFFEYALLALIAVALMVVVYNAFKTQINSLFTKIDSGVTTGNPTLNTK